VNKSGKKEISHHHRHEPNNVHLKFKPLVEVDPTIIVRREPLKNPLPGNYLLSKTASTEGIASKKSLELKKRYLLGETGGNNAVMKSDSTSTLDTKFKSFASNISECQKLLNPSPEISPSMQTFLQRIDRNNELNKSQHSIGLSKAFKDKYNNNNNNHEEKENRSIDSNKKEEVTIETVNTALIENKIREMSPEVPKVPEIIEIVDLVTPEKKQPIVDLENIEIPQNTIDDNKQFIENMEKSSSSTSSPTHESTKMKIKSKLDSMFIDLTGDSPPPKEKPSIIIEQNNNNNDDKVCSGVVPDIISNISLNNNHKANNENNIERPRSPAHETTIEVPQMWTKHKKSSANKEIDTDSLSNDSSTSSLEDIPHFILDSTTSPETHNDALNFQSQPPRLEVRDTSGELMQIDSLMIIDGQYIGDPEDLPLFKQQQQNENPSIDTSMSLTKPLKFDTKNENKLESLKNLPLIVSHDDLQFDDKKQINSPDDGDKTPMANAPTIHISDSENDLTGQGGLTETELSDWAADDAVSENFMDIEFALNSAKGTVKRNKKKVKSSSQLHKLNGSNHVITAANASPKRKSKDESEVECGILKNLAIEEIDFMDTGSENDSLHETPSTTNKVVLKNHGYVTFIDNGYNSSNSNQYNAYKNQGDEQAKKLKEQNVVEAINMEMVNNTDYFIEQGAYILSNNSNNISNDLKTPINDSCNFPDSLNASCDDIEDDSLINVDDRNQETSLPSTTVTTATETTTEELTIVTSPLESLPKHAIETSANDKNNQTLSSSSDSTLITSTTTSSESNENHHNNDNADDERVECPPTRFERSAERASSTRMSREHIEEMGGYEEYVKNLQLKIAQISSVGAGRESRRKLSKSDLLGESTHTPDELMASTSAAKQTQESNKSIYGALTQVEAPQTLSMKLEELTKERVKQKDIIHDLVMNKLQAKKQMNAEKRMNRSKNRSSFMTIANQQHQQQQPASDIISQTNGQLKSNVITYRESKNNLYEREKAAEAAAIENNDDIKSQSATSSPSKVMKTQSFHCHHLNQFSANGTGDNNSSSTIHDNNFRTPAPPPRNRLYSTNDVAEKMREEARARAKLKSNEDLGLSPEEKILMLRKRYNLVHSHSSCDSQQMSSSLFTNGRNQSDDMKYREKKLSVSKSFNDISRINRQSKDFSLTATTFQKPISDCMSDPNLVNDSIDESNKISTSPTTPKTSKSHRRDSERRRSLIQTVSDFFHKKRDQSASNKDLTNVSPPAASKDKLSETSSSSTMSVFSRFKLSPKSKDNSSGKDKAKVG
jgi:hypothetical protein